MSCQCEGFTVRIATLTWHFASESMPTRDKPSISVEITEHPRYQLHAQLIEQEQRMHTVLDDLPVQDTTLYMKDYAHPAGSSLRGPPPKDSNGLTTHSHQTPAGHMPLSGVLHLHKGPEGEKDFRLAKPAMPGTSQVKFTGSKQTQGSNHTLFSQKHSGHRKWLHVVVGPGAGAGVGVSVGVGVGVWNSMSLSL